MDAFEYITVLLSIILGVGVAQLLPGSARLLRDGRSLASAWWVIVIVLNLLIGMLQVWWVSFIWRGVEGMDLRRLRRVHGAAHPAQPARVLGAAFGPAPRRRCARARLRRAAAAVLRDHRTFPSASFVQQWLLDGNRPAMDLDSMLRLLWIVLAVPGFCSRRIAVQAGVAALSLVLMLACIYLLFLRIR
ncbi:MAG: hypothetical protein EOP90_14280 [Lysobacteraceae bacterium]|nr:MAG: hypothetical protein EOP90_14280 [Xanthomonadaceae bacterium]